MVNRLPWPRQKVWVVAQGAPFTHCPVPLKAMLCEEPAALSGMATVAVAAPEVVGH